MKVMAALILALVLIIFPLTPLAAETQRVGPVYRIGVLSIGSPPDSYVDGFRQGLHELGYIEGQNVVLEYRWAAGRLERLPELAAELVQLPVDIIFAGGGTAAVQAAQRATRTIPIVTPGVADPERSRLVASLMRPGGNVTGLVFSTTELDARRLRLLKEAMPRISRVAILWNPSHPLHGAALKQVAESGRGLGVRAQPLEVWGPEHFDLAFTATRRGYAEAVMVLASPMHYRHLRQIAQQALKHRLPTISDFRELAEAGGFMAFGPSLPGMYRRAASFVDKILKGVRPGELPMEQSTKSELVINLKTAKALGLTIPPSLLLRADQVIE